MNKKRLNTCISPDGNFIFGLHKPVYQVTNVRLTSQVEVIGYDEKNQPVHNSHNFVEGDIACQNTQGVYEILNPFPIWGATYILKKPADKYAEDISTWRFNFDHDIQSHPLTGKNDLIATLANQSLSDTSDKTYSISDLPQCLLVALAQTTDCPDILIRLAHIACDLVYINNSLAGIRFKKNAKGQLTPVIHNHELFEVVVNNPFLPDKYKQTMVLIPGSQGNSPIIGEYKDSKTHIWEYLRANSYIPWGHYASNMAQDSIRYSVSDLSIQDIYGLRHLYYQRVMLIMAQELDIDIKQYLNKLPISNELIEMLRKNIIKKLQDTEIRDNLNYTGTIWGWNYGFDYSSSGYRLNASHQQIHQQFALSRSRLYADINTATNTYAIGDRIAEFIDEYQSKHNILFFEAFIKAICSNKRMDERTDRPNSLIIHEDNNIILYVPKAQRSQCELQILTKKPIGNILEADISMRNSLDKGIYLAIKCLYQTGAQLITAYEISKRFDMPDLKQHLMYCFLPKHPQSPGAFSEAQGRWITGHFPEDYAEIARNALR